MKLDDTTLGVFKDLESTVIAFWRQEADLTDHGVDRVYEAALDRHDAEVRGRRPRPHRLTGLEALLLERIEAACAYRLGKGPRPETSALDVPAIDGTALVHCLKQLRKSVAAHSRGGTRQGYLAYVAKFLPPS